MKSSFVVLASILLLGMVVSAETEIAIKKYLLALSPDVMIKCLKEFNLETDKEKIFNDQSAIDPTKLSCFFACTLKENGALVNGEIKYDVLEGIFTKLVTEEENLTPKLKILKNCIPQGPNSKSDCENVQTMVVCGLQKIKEQGL